MSDSIMPTYGRLSVTFEKGLGAWLWDTSGKRYLDALSGIGVCGLGHAHPAIAATLAQQGSTLIHTSNLYHIPQQQQLADELIRLSGMEQAFFTNSGAEACEAAIKIARLYGHNKGIAMPAIIVAEGSFHGRTLATLSATGNRKIQAGFEPLVQGFIRAKFNNIDELREIAKNSHDAVAILIEPIQGEGGINIPDDNYLNAVRELCHEQGWLMMLDEVQTGICRTGEWFAWQHSDIKPDVATLAKGLGNGFPIGACLVQGPAANVLQPGNHGSTFGGNPLACSVALTVLKIMEDEQLVARTEQLGEQICTNLKQAFADETGVVDIRGKGLMIGIELDRSCDVLLKDALEAGLLISIQADKTIRLLPPFILSDEEADELVTRLVKVITTFLATETVCSLGKVS
ncbi:MAG: aspartate aminotransferase family protein [Gammaproteobacteria bacterium]|nr:aspartate aminotransferase family protein [Gammaproteobacteria bacterium]